MNKARVCVHIIRPLGYERVYLPLHEVADTPFHIQEDGMCTDKVVGVDYIYPGLSPVVEEMK